LAAAGKSWLDSLLTKLARAMIHGSLRLAIAPPRIPAGELGSSASRAVRHGVIASGGAALQLTEKVATAPFRVGNHPGGDLLSLPFKGVFVGAPPAQEAFSPLLLSVQGVEPCCQIADTPVGKTRHLLAFAEEEHDASRFWYQEVFWLTWKSGEEEVLSESRNRRGRIFGNKSLDSHSLPVIKLRHGNS